MPFFSACGEKDNIQQDLGPALPAGSRVLALGDSLTAGVGAAAGQDWPALLAAHSGWVVTNAGVSGDTSAQALARLPAALAQVRPALVIVSIGGNDFLRRADAAGTAANIGRICDLSTASGARVVLVGVPRADVWAAAAGQLADHAMFAELAAGRERVALLSGAWARVLSKPEWRSDQIHANAQGYAAFAGDLVAFLRLRKLL